MWFVKEFAFDAYIYETYSDHNWMKLVNISEEANNQHKKKPEGDWILPVKEDVDQMIWYTLASL